LKRRSRGAVWAAKANLGGWIREEEQRASFGAATAAAVEEGEGEGEVEEGWGSGERLACGLK
jgi:hypothetical protein